MKLAAFGQKPNLLLPERRPGLLLLEIRGLQAERLRPDVPLQLAASEQWVRRMHGQ